MMQSPILTLAESANLTEYRAAGGSESLTNYRIVENLVRREVVYCVSALVITAGKVAADQGAFGDTDYHEVLDLLGGVGPDEDEVYEHWIVTEWAKRRLEGQGERVGDIEGVTVWGRTITGQSIALDDVWHAIAAEMQILHGQAHDWSRERP